MVHQEYPAYQEEKDLVYVIYLHVEYTTVLPLLNREITVFQESTVQGAPLDLQDNHSLYVSSVQFISCHHSMMPQVNVPPGVQSGPPGSQNPQTKGPLGQCLRVSVDILTQ